MDVKEILKKVDHTNLKQTVVWPDIKALCDEGIHYGCASVCIPPSFVKQAAEYSESRIGICTVIGFPNGYSTAEAKCFEAERAIHEGADEIDMVINIGMLKEKRYAELLNELKAMRHFCGSKILKVIIEACLLTDEEKVKMCGLVSDSGAGYIKTSTGFSTGGATREDIALFRKNLSPRVKIKAAGGIKSLEDAEDFIKLGADRLGTSSIVKIVKGMEVRGGY